MMRRHRSPTRLSCGHAAVLLLGAALMTGCKGTPYEMSFDAARFDVGRPDLPTDKPVVPSCTAETVPAMLETRCGYCHCAGCSLDLVSPGLVERIVGVQPLWADPAPRGCREGVLLAPGLPPSGLLLDKLSSSPVACGNSMRYVNDEELDCVAAWLRQQLGARGDASVGDALPADADDTDGGTSADASP